MKRILKCVSGICVIAVFTSCGAFGNMSYSDALDKNQRKFDDPSAQQDARFLVEAQSFVFLINAMADTANSRGYARVVSDFAKRVKSVQNNYMESLEEVADDLNVALPDEMSNEHRSYLTEINSADAGDFDEAFLRNMERATDYQVNNFEKLATEGHWEEVRSFAARRVKDLRQLEEEADQLEDELR